jgi:hypothetical protein
VNPVSSIGSPSQVGGLHGPAVPDAPTTQAGPCPERHARPVNLCSLTGRNGLHGRILPGLSLYTVCAHVLMPGDCAVRINASAAEHHSAWWRCAFGAAVTETLSQGSRPLGLQLLHFVPVRKVRRHIL